MNVRDTVHDQPVDPAAATRWTHVDTHRAYWDDFYSRAADHLINERPSTFAQWVRAQLIGGRLVDIGTGTGRDGLWFASEGFAVTGYDYSPASVLLATQRAQADGLQAGFEELDLYDHEAVTLVGKSLADESTPVAVYARFLVHALEDAGRAHLFELAGAVGARGGPFFAEFRTGKDKGRRHVFGEHFRLFLDPEQVVDELRASGAASVHVEEGQGLAVYRDEDPHIARLVARWA